MERFELMAAAVLWRGDEILVMKRATGFSSGGWFFPGGHVEPGERPAEACLREILEETGIEPDPGSLELVDVMTFAIGERTAHCLVYRATCPPTAECVLNDEHLTARWLTPGRYVERFLDSDMLRARGVDETGIARAGEITRVLATAVRRRALAPPRPSI